MMNKFFLIIVVQLMLFVVPLNGQDRDVKLIIKSIENQFNVKFVYDSRLKFSNIDNVTQKCNSLDEALSSLLNGTDLLYEQKGKYVIIRAPKSYVLSGYVVDSLSSEPLVGVTISSLPNIFTYSNEYGFFSIILVEGVRELTISSVAHVTKKVSYNISDSRDVEIRLMPNNLSLSDVVVKSGEIRNIIETRILGGYSVNSEQLKYVPSFLGESDMLKYFQLLPGVNSGREGSSNVNIRGGSSDQTLILLDDIPIYNSAHAFGFVSLFAGDNIKSAELYKGYIPPRYGGRLSGVVSMKIREGNREEHKQMIQIGTTTFSALLEGKISEGKGSYLVSGRYFVPNLFLNIYGLFANNNGVSYPIFGFYDATAKVSYDITKKSTLYGSFYSGRDAINFITDNNSMYQSSKTVGGINWGNVIGSIRLSSELSNRSYMSSTIYYSRLSNTKADSYKDSDNNYISSDIDSKLDEIGVKVNIKHNISDWYSLNYGTNIAYQYFTPQLTTLNNGGVCVSSGYGVKKQLSANIYLDNRFQLDSFILNIGGRLSHYNNSEIVSLFEPRVAVTYYSKSGSAWISYTKNSQPLFSMNQMSASVPLDYWMPFHNVEELPTSQQLSLGGKYRFSSRFNIQTELYYKRIENLSVVYSIDDYLADDRGYYIGNGTAYGLEVLSQYSRDRFSSMLSYTYSKSLHHIDNKSVDYIYDTPHNLNIYLSYDTYRTENKKYTLSANINYKTGMPHPMSNTIFLGYGTEDYLYNYPSYANSRLSNFFRVDLNFTMEKRLKKGSRVWQLSILNATAHKNPYVLYNDKGRVTAFQLIPFMPSFSYIRKF